MSKDPQLDELERVHSALKSIDSSLAHLAAMTRLPLLYAPDEIKELAQQYRQRCDMDAAAYRVVQNAQAALPEETKNRDAFAKLYGEEETQRRFAPFDAATRTKQAAHTAMMDFGREHPLIEQLVRGYRQE